jgi:hypothetical protein
MPSEQHNYWQKDRQLLPLVARRPELLKLIGPQLLLRRYTLAIGESDQMMLKFTKPPIEAPAH